MSPSLVTICSKQRKTPSLIPKTQTLVRRDAPKKILAGTHGLYSTVVQLGR